MDKPPKFCFVCGLPLKVRYPGNDPENGPASPRCPDDSHQTVQERVDEVVSLMSSEDLLDEVLVRVQLEPGVEPATRVHLGLALGLAESLVKRALDEADDYNSPPEDEQ
jgi:hypothetical protein